VFAEGVADFEVLEPANQLLRLVVELAQFGMTHLVDAFHLPHHQFGIADDLERCDLVFGGVAESGEESLILGVVIGVEAKVFAELGNRVAGGVLNGDTITGGAGIAAGSAINVRRVGGRRGFRRGEKIAGAGRARRHGSSLQDRVYNVGVRAIRTNAAWASHPGRIVIADVLTAVFRAGERSSRNRTPKNAMHRRPPEACASGLRFSVSILLGRRIS